MEQTDVVAVAEGENSIFSYHLFALQIAVLKSWRIKAFNKSN